MNAFELYLNNLNILAIVDVTVVFMILLSAFLFFKQNRRLRVFWSLLTLGVLVIAINLIYLLSDMKYLLVAKVALDMVMIFTMLSIAVVYQAELRALFSRIGSHRDEDMFSGGFGTDDELRIATSEILTATQNMAKKDIGALILLTPSSVPEHILSTGTELSAKLTSALIESIFINKSPLHDGAVVIKGNKILSAGCFLPLTQETNISKDLGTRHRAAIGISEECDVLAIVVSEETGIISTVKGGKIERYMTSDKLKNQIEELYGISTNAQIKKKINNDKLHIFKRKKHK